MEIQDKSKFNKRFSNQVPTKFPKDNKDRVSKPKSQGEEVEIHLVRNLLVPSVVKKHMGECLMERVIALVVESHKVRDYPMIKAKGKDSIQAQANVPDPDAPKKNNFYARLSRVEQEDSTNVVSGMLQMFSINVYALLDPGAT